MNPTNWLRRAVYTDGFKIVEKIYHVFCCEVKGAISHLYICTPSGIIQLRVSDGQNGAHVYETTEGHELTSANCTLGFLHTLCEITSIPYEPVEITCILSGVNCNAQSHNAQSHNAKPRQIIPIDPAANGIQTLMVENSARTKADAKLVQLSCPVLKNSWNSIYLESFAAPESEPNSIIGFDLTGFISKWDLSGQLTNIYNYVPETVGCIKTDDIYLYVADSSGLLHVYNVITGGIVCEMLFEAEIISIAVIHGNNVYVYLLCIDGVIVKLSRETWKCVSNCKRADYFRSKKMISAGQNLYVIGEFDHIDRINFDKMSHTPITFAEFDFTKDEFISLTADKSETFIAAGTKCGYLYIVNDCGEKLGANLRPNYIRYYCGTYGSKIANVTFGLNHFYVAFFNGFISRYDVDLLRLANFAQQSAVVKKYMMLIYLVLKKQGLPKDLIGEVMLLL